MVAAALVGCGSAPLTVANESPVPVTAVLIAYPDGVQVQHDWPNLMRGQRAIGPGEQRTFSRQPEGVTYMLAIEGPGLVGAFDYALYPLPVKAERIAVRGDERRVVAWMDGETPVPMRP